nr:MAG TPA: hypothetical protein [Bacteriophage sp.]
MKLIKFIFALLLCLLGIAFLVFEIIIFIKYKDMTPAETPNWVQWFLWG